MKREIKYIPCTHCAARDDDSIQRFTCHYCRGKKKIIDPETILCNMCGESLCIDISVLSGKWQSNEPQGLQDAKVTGGYESYHLLDMTSYTFSLCEHCLRKMFNQFKIKPDIDDALDRAPYSWEEDQNSYEERLWRDAGKHHQAYLDRICNKNRNCGKEAVYTIFLSDEFTEDTSCEDHKDSWYNCVNAKLVKFIPNVLKPFL